MQTKAVQSSIEIACPVRGIWSFLNPPGHHPDAKDFVAVDASGNPYRPADRASHLFWRLDASRAFAWEKEVLAPFDAVIVETEGACDDRASLNLVRDAIAGLVLARRRTMDDAKFFLGNHVVMRSDGGVFALFAHLRKGSVRAKHGERVRTGDSFALVGNSGNSIQPHLHFQLMKENSQPSSLPVPFVFSHFETWQGNAWKQERMALPRNGQVFRAHGVS
jgi:hypothetical protein